MNRTFKESQDLLDLANEIIIKEGIDLYPAKVKYLMVDPTISKTIYGRCIRCSSELAYFSDTDYIIEISKEYWELLSEKSKYLLLLHELKHILVKYNESKDEYSFNLRRHDLEDFREIVKKHGVDWLQLADEKEMIELSKDEEATVDVEEE
jgi:predicted metallopeptidase